MVFFRDQGTRREGRAIDYSSYSAGRDCTSMERFEEAVMRTGLGAESGSCKGKLIEGIYCTINKDNVNLVTM